MSKPSSSRTMYATPCAHGEGHHDPNVLVSAVITFQLVVCPILIAELRGVLERPKFRRWIAAEDAAAFVDLLEREAEPWVDPLEVPPVTGDPKDDYLVALHRSCQADLLVSGDSDLLALTADDVAVLTPVDLLARLPL